MRQFMGLLVGLGLGIAGATLFVGSLPPEEGSPEERVEVVELELMQAWAKIEELEARQVGKRSTRTADDGARSIVEDLKAGRAVNVDDVFAVTKPFMRDVGPIFDRIRIREQKRRFDRVAGELTRKYDLSESEHDRLTRWLDRRAEENAERFRQVVESDNTGLEDLIRATNDIEGENGLKGLEDYVEGMLTGEARDRFQEDRLQRRVESVQSEADRQVQRLDGIVDLDEDQKDEIFVRMVGSSKDYDPSMEIEGLGSETLGLIQGQSREDAILGALRPEQVEAYHIHREERVEEARRELEEIGLTLPPDWSLIDDDDF